MITRTEYLEKPASADEKSITRVIESFLEGRRRGDADALRSCLLDSAFIEVEGGKRRLAKYEFLEYVREHNSTIRRLYYTDLLIRLVLPNNAVVSYNCYRQHVGSNELHINRRLLRFMRNSSDQQWRIMDSTCID